MPDPDTFTLGTLNRAVEIDDGTIDQVSRPGAGNLESGASEDQYQFHVDDPSTLTLAFHGYSYRWRLISSTGQIVASAINSYDSDTASPIPPGDYTLIIGDHNSLITPGYYRRTGSGPTPFTLTVAAHQSFAVDAVAGVEVSNGVPGAGAGSLETTASEDDYTFSLTQPAPVMVDVHSAPSEYGTRYLAWSLVRLSDQTTVASGSDGAITGTLPAGQYRLQVGTVSNHTGTYSLRLQTVPDPDTFTLGTLNRAVEIDDGTIDQVSRPGAGNLESGASEDQYQFHVDDPSTLTLAFHGYSYRWRLISSTGQIVASAINSYDSDTASPIPPGDYTLIIGDHNSLITPGYYRRTGSGPTPFTLTVAAHQ